MQPFAAEVRMRVRSLVAVLAIVSGCSPIRSYVYGPTPPTGPADADGRIDGHAAVSYRVPPDDPHGELALAVQRVTDVKGRGRHKVHAVVVRMVAHNRDGDVWSIECGAIDAVIDGGRHEYPIRATSEGESVWMVVLEPGETRTIDLYYELPAKIAKPKIAVDWRVLTTSGTITRATTSLARRIM
jgi:hypothetical protein